MKAWMFIEKPEHWTQYTASRNVNGAPVWCKADDAFSFCALGAIARCYDDHDAEILVKEQVRVRLGGGSILKFNDNHSHSEVLALLKELDV